MIISQNSDPVWQYNPGEKKEMYSSAIHFHTFDIIRPNYPNMAPLRDRLTTPYLSTTRRVNAATLTGS